MGQATASVTRFNTTLAKSGMASQTAFGGAKLAEAQARFVRETTAANRQVARQLQNLTAQQRNVAQQTMRAQSSVASSTMKATKAQAQLNQEATKTAKTLAKTPPPEH